MPGQLRATSKLLEQFLASHSFSPRNTRSTRKEVDKEGDKKVCRRSSTEIFRVFSRVSWSKGNCDEKQRRDKRLKSTDHYCCAFARKRDMIASSTITTNASAPKKM